MHSLAVTTQPSADPAERRQHERVKVALFVSWGTSDECEHDARLTSLSAGGYFLQSQEVLTQGQIIFVKLRLAPGSEIIIRGEVRYHVGGVGSGVQFLDVDAEERAALESLVGFYRNVSRVERPAAEVVPVMTQAPEPTREKEDKEDAASVERSEHERLRVPMEVNWGTEVDCQWWSQLNSLGEGGCFLETRFALKEGQRVYFRLWLSREGKRLVCGEVRHAGAGGGVGVRFLDLTERDRADLKNLLDFLRDNDWDGIDGTVM